MEDIDVLSEYEKIFGKEERKTLFAVDDEEYYSLRQQIIAEKPVYFHKSALPFDGVRMYSYEEFLVLEYIQKITNQGKKVFYIKRRFTDGSIINAFGYYIPGTKHFVLMKYSTFPYSSYFTKKMEMLGFYTKYLFSRKGNVVTLKNDIDCTSASLAASVVLGADSLFHEWKDSNRQQLGITYARFTLPANEEVMKYEKKSLMFSNPYVADIIKPNFSEPYRVVEKMPSATKPPVTSSVVPTTHFTSDKHLFYIKEPGVCSVAGYFDPETTYFYILKDSLITLVEDFDYMNSTSSRQRARFINRACVKESGYYKVTRDAKIRSASAAACYSLGKTVIYTKWVDANGKYLKDFYPDKFIIGGEDVKVSNDRKNQVENDLYLFYIHKDSSPEKYCKATATYSRTTGKMTLQKGSIIALESSLNYRYTSGGLARITFIGNHCTKTSKGYVVKEDCVIETPSAAASIVIGRSANGRGEWINQEGKTLNQIFPKI